MLLSRSARWMAIVVLHFADFTIAIPSTIHTRHMRQYDEFPSNNGIHRMLAGGARSDSVCSKAGSFLGVGNVDCLHSNLGTAIFLLAVIIVVSLLFERGIHAVRRAIECPQLKKIVNRVFEEVMILGFLSMIIFTLNTSGLMAKIHGMFNEDLSASERLHFYEFFHYIVFLTMIYFIIIVLFLLFVGTVVPKLIWKRHAIEDDDSERDDLDISDTLEENDTYSENLQLNQLSRGRNDTAQPWASGPSFTSYTSGPSFNSVRQLYRSSAIRGRADSGMDLVQGSRAYALLLQRYQREGWSFRFNIKKQWNLWKSFEILAYNICQNRSGYIYKNPDEMNRLFGVARKFHGDGSAKPMTFDHYHVLCMRNLLFNISHLHFSAFFVLLVIAVVPVLCPHYDHWIFLAVGGILLLVNIVIFLKVLKILRGIVDDRLRIISSNDIRHRMPRASLDPFQTKKRPSLRVVALSVRAVIRMQMSSLCHRQLHYHNHRFWFGSPRFLLRLFHFATIGQAFYLVWFTLVEWQTVVYTTSSYYLIPIMMLLPVIAMCVVTPMTMPSLVLVMSLTGIFVELNGNDQTSGHRPTQNETKTHIRLLRRSYLKSHYTDTEDPASPIISQDCTQRSLDIQPASSPSSVFLRIYDSPPAAAQQLKAVENASPRRLTTARDDAPFLRRNNSSGQLMNAGTSDDPRDLMHTRRSFDLPSYHAAATHTPDAQHGNTSLEVGRHRFQPLLIGSGTEVSTPRTSTPPISPAFKNYCSKYGGYPDA